MGESHEQTQRCTPLQKARVRNGQRYGRTPTCSWPPLGSLAPSTACSPWHPHSTSLPDCTPQPHGQVTGVTCHLLGAGQAVGQARALPAWLTAPCVLCPAWFSCPQGAHQRCEATSPGHMEPPTTPAVPQPLQQCPTSAQDPRAQCCPSPQLWGLRTH